MFSSFTRKLIFGSIIVAVLSIYLFSSDETTYLLISEPKDYNPCCDFPCQHHGVCVNYANNTYSCDCTSTGFHGLNCHIPSWQEWLKQKIRPTPEQLHNMITGYPSVWAAINRMPWLHNKFIAYIYLSRGDMVDSPPKYESKHTYISLDVYFNDSYFGRSLPPVPEDCPTPMGSKGPKSLPPVDELFRKVFLRKNFKPDPSNSNLLFQYYAQHFTHQFFRTDYATNGLLTKGNGGVDASNIYGLTAELQEGLRSKVDGKLITQVIQGEEFPPLLKNVNGVKMDYPPHIPIPEEGKFALGHPFFALLPGLFVYSTIWVREHNRICEVLKREHPHWQDEQLYQTAKLIVVGEIIKITIEDYVQHLSQYNLKISFKPELVHGSRFQYHNRIHAEFDQLYHWHPLVPDGLEINGTYYKLMEMAFSNAAVFKHGMDTFINALATNRAGQLTMQNHPEVVLPIFSKAINNTRKLRFPSFNQYRKRFGLRSYQSFEELTGEHIVSKELKAFYEDIDAVEFYVGLITEHPGSSLAAISMVNIGGPYSVKGLIANPICSPGWWKPSTFGGEIGFQIVKTASLKKLFCKNMKTPCKHISFTVPKGTP